MSLKQTFLKIETKNKTAIISELKVKFILFKNTTNSMKIKTRTKFAVGTKTSLYQRPLCIQLNQLRHTYIYKLSCEWIQKKTDNIQ